MRRMRLSEHALARTGRRQTVRRGDGVASPARRDRACKLERIMRRSALSLTALGARRGCGSSTEGAGATDGAGQCPAACQSLQTSVATAARCRRPGRKPNGRRRGRDATARRRRTRDRRFDAEHQPELDGDGADGADAPAGRKRRRGSRGGQRRRKSSTAKPTPGRRSDADGDGAPGMAPRPTGRSAGAAREPAGGPPHSRGRRAHARAQAADRRHPPGAAGRRCRRWPSRRQRRSARRKQTIAEPAGAAVASAPPSPR